MSSENKDKPKIHFSDFLKKNKGKLLSIFIIIILGLLILIATSGRFILPQLLQFIKIGIPLLTKFIGI